MFRRGAAAARLAARRDVKRELHHLEEGKEKKKDLGERLYKLFMGITEKDVGERWWFKFARTFGTLGLGSYVYKFFLHTNNHGGLIDLNHRFPADRDSSHHARVSSEGLICYKQFIEGLEDDILPAEAQRRYEEYRSEYISTQKRAFFSAHKNEEWLKDKYHPTNLLTVIERRNENARKISKDFLLDLQGCTLDLGPAFNAAATGKSGQV